MADPADIAERKEPGGAFCTGGGSSLAVLFGSVFWVCCSCCWAGGAAATCGGAGWVIFGVLPFGPGVPGFCAFRIFSSAFRSSTGCRAVAVRFWLERRQVLGGW